MAEPKLKSLTIFEKLEIIKMIDGGKPITEVAKELDINRNTLHYIYKQRDKFKSEVAKTPETINKKRIKQTKFPEMEESVLTWMHQARDRGSKITGSQIKAVALENASKSGLVEFSGSNGWLQSFFRRHGIVLSEFNKFSDTTLQNIKVKDIEASSIIECEEYEVEDNKKNIKLIEGNSQQQEEEIVEEPLEYIYTGEWKNWCRTCGSDTDQFIDIEQNVYEVITLLLNIQPDESTKFCEQCYSTFHEIASFMDKAMNCESMFKELDDFERKNSLYDELALKIRSDYGISVKNEQHTENLIVEQLDEVEKLDEYEDDQEMSEEVKADVVTIYSNAQEYYNEDGANEMMGIEVFDSEEIVKDNSKLSTQNSSLRHDESEYDFSCHICCRKFDRMCFLTNHTRDLHGCLPQVACITCGKYLATWESIMSHKRKHSTEPANFCCLLCNSRFVTQAGLNIHIKMKHEGVKAVKAEKTSTACDVCNKVFKDANTLKQHSRVHLPDDAKFPFMCDLCDKRLVNKYSLKHHIASVHEKTKTISCNICQKLFASRSNLRSHLISHTTENVACPICNAVFKNRISLQSHKKLHNNSKNFACPDCGKLFFNRNHLERHRISHSDLRSYQCEHPGCVMAYKWEKDLKAHALTHLSDTIICCGMCNRRFANPIALEKHILKVHHSEVEEIHEEVLEEEDETAQCPYCVRRYNDQASLDKHIMKSHPNEVVVQEEIL